MAMTSIVALAGCVVTLILVGVAAYLYLQEREED